MKDLAKADERKIVSALEKAVKYANAGEMPTAAVIKAASEARLPMQATQRMCEAFNTSKTLAHFKKTAGADRAESFPIADTRAVLAALWPKEPETPAKKAAASRHPQFVKFAEDGNFMRVRAPITLPALVDAPPDPYESDPGYLAKRAIDEHNKLVLLLKEARAAYRDMFYRITGAAAAAASYWKQAALDREPFDLVEKRAFATFGATARPLMDIIVEKGSLDDRRVAVKRASAGELGSREMSWPEGEPYDAIADAVFFAKQAYRIAKEAAAVADTIDEHAIGKVDWLPSSWVEESIDRLAGAEIEKAAKRDMPAFTEQDRPAKVKEIYRALKREHPGMPAEMKARIAARQGKPGKQKQGPPYRGPLARPKKSKEEKKSSAPLDVVFG